MRVGHGLEIGGVRLGRLSLRLLVGAHPGEVRVTGDRGGRRGHGRGRGRHGPRGARCHARGRGRGRRRPCGGGRGRHRHLPGTGRVGLRQGRGAARRRVGLAVVGAVEGDDHRRLLLGRRDRGGLALPERREVDRYPRDREAAEALLQAGDAVLPLAIEGDRQVRAIAEDAVDELAEHAAGADLQEHARAARPHALDLLDEAHRPRDLLGEPGADPVRVRGIRRRLGVGPHLGGGRRDGDPGEEFGEPRARRRHQWAVERRRHGQALGGDALARQVLLDDGDLGLGAGEHDLGGMVVVGHDDRGAELREERAHLVERPRHGGHRAGRCGGVAHELAATAGDGDQAGVIEGARGGERGDLAEAVAAQAQGRDAGRAHHAEERQAGEADGRLGPLGGGEPLGLRLPVRVGEHGARVRHVVDALTIEARRGGLVPDGARDVEAHRDLGPHPDVLAALSGEQEGDRAGAGAYPVVHARRRRERRVRLRGEPGARLLELGDEVDHVARHHREAVGVRGAERLLRGAREIGEGGRIRPRGAAGGLLAPGGEPRRARVREHQELGGEAAEAEGARGGPGVLLQRDVEVAPAEAEARHRRAPRVRGVPDPRARLGVEVERALLDLELGIGPVHLDGGRQHLVVQGHDGLEHPRGARGGLGVADLRLHRAERAPLPVGAARLAEGDLEPLELGGVAGLGGRAVRLDELDGVRPVAGDLVGAPERARLALGQRRVDALAAAVG